MASSADGIDPAAPFKGLVVCCTSIPPEQRTDLAKKVHELGGIHKYDLTPDATHLVVGDYDTPKYRHVARERPDVKPMDAAWVDAVSHLWKHDEDMDFAALETQHRLKPLETCGAQPPALDARQSLLICLTGFGDQRDDIATSITSNGGRYTGDLTRKCTHLIVNKPEGKKFNAAKAWDVYTVTLGWLHQSLERGMILDEAKFDPLLPPDEQGLGAWLERDPACTSLGKRSHSAMTNRPEDGVRKLRKTASMKLSSQRNHLWGDILGTSNSRDDSPAPGPRAEAPAQDDLPSAPMPGQDEAGVFSNCVFAIHGFDRQREKVLEETVVTLAGAVVPTLDAASSHPGPGEAPRRFLIVPQTSQPETHPRIPADDVHVVTEFYVERCMHNKRFQCPSEHVFGRPFPLFPIHGFSDLTVCSAAFTGLELSQVARSVRQLGAKFEEEFRRSTTLVVCNSLQAMRKEKLRYALEWGVPVVSAEWLWECISTGFNVPLEGYIFPEIREQFASRGRPSKDDDDRGSGRPEQQKPLAPTSVAVASEGKASRPAGSGLDATAFDRDSLAKGSRMRAQYDSTTSADFMTARTHHADTFVREFDAPLGELSGARLNKSPSPPGHAARPTRTRSEPWPRSLEKAADLTRGPSAPPPDPRRGTGAAETDEAKRKTNDEARQQAREAERLVLSSKLSSLIQATTDGDGRDGRSQTAAARPRRRQVFGRAISNASNASSAASADSARPAPETLRSMKRAATADQDDEAAADAGPTASTTPPPPPTTQLEYQDPHVLESKALLVSKMMMSTTAADAPAPAPPAAAVAGLSSGRLLRKR